MAFYEVDLSFILTPDSETFDHSLSAGAIYQNNSSQEIENGTTLHLAQTSTFYYEYLDFVGGERMQERAPYNKQVKNGFV